MIETRRLWLVPLNARQMWLWTDDISALEAELDCAYRAEPLEGLFLEIVKGQAAAAGRDPENMPFYGFWLLLRKADRAVVGSADFKGPPDESGAVEIGYGLGAAYERNGYMTEAVRALCAWALGQAGVSSVIAETEKDNQASRRVLEKCGFARDRAGATLWWRLRGSK